MEFYSDLNPEFKENPELQQAMATPEYGQRRGFTQLIMGLANKNLSPAALHAVPGGLEQLLKDAKAAREAYEAIINGEESLEMTTAEKTLLETLPFLKSLYEDGPRSSSFPLGPLRRLLLELITPSTVNFFADPVQLKILESIGSLEEKKNYILKHASQFK